jgi:eukaryotic-like serine/threonine-protein kinase
MSFNIGDSIGDYQIIGVLGAGGMGKVYKVKNVISDRVDALKILLPNLADDPELADRFTREIKVLASLNHPNIAGLRTAFRLDNQLLMVMEYVEGKTLDDRTKAGPIPVPDAINYITQALSALGYAHKQGIIHRDIKPANMMLTPDGVIKLMDFGIAKTKSDKKLTQTGTTMGSLFYMSAEQVQGNELDGRADLYSVGVSLYEMVTGARPFQGKSDFEIMVAQLQQAPLPPIQMVPSLPKALNDIILIAMEKDPAKRFQTAEAFSAALSSITNSLQSTPMQAVAGNAAYTPTGTQVFQSVPPAYGAPLSAGSATGMMGAGSAMPAAGATAPQKGAFLNTASTPTVLAPKPGASSAPQGPDLAPSPVPSHGLPAPSSSKSHRGLYITLGALIVVVGLAAAAVVGTHFLKARASGDQASSITTTASSSSAAVAPGNPTSNSTQPSAGGANLPGGGSALPSGGQVNTDPNSMPQNDLGSAPGSVSHPGSPDQGGGTQSSGGKGTKQHGGQANWAPGQPSGASNPLPDGDQPNPVAGPGGNPQGGQPAAGSPSANTQELQELTDLHEKLSARAQSANDSVESLRKQMEAGGNNLRGEISASQTRMKIYMGKFEAALNSGDTDSARKYMDLAEHEVDKLEAFLGH